MHSVLHVNNKSASVGLAGYIYGGIFISMLMLLLTLD